VLAHKLNGGTSSCGAMRLREEISLAETFFSRHCEETCFGRRGNPEKTKNKTQKICIFSESPHQFI